MELNKNIVSEIIKEYFEMHNYSKLTKNGVIWNLNKFDRFLQEKTDTTNYRDIKEEHYYQYSAYLKENNVTDYTRKTYLNRIRKIFMILEEEEKILVNPFYRIKEYKIIKNIKDKIISENEMNELLSIPDLKTPTGFRDRTILEVLYGTGIRANELVNLELSHFLQEERILFIHNGKGRRDRIMPLGENAYNYLIQYVRKVRRKLVKRKKIKYLFVSYGGRKLYYPHLSYIIKKTAGKMKSKKKVSCHILRHSFATHLIKSGAGIRQVQLLLGHKCLRSTEFYINLNKEHLKTEYEKYHPLENELYFDVYAREQKVLNSQLELGQPIVKMKLKN